MEIIIAGEAKEIAALVLGVQERQTGTKECGSPSRHMAGEDVGTTSGAGKEQNINRTFA